MLSLIIAVVLSDDLILTSSVLFHYFILNY